MQNLFIWYWDIDAYLSELCAAMKQFYEIYTDNEFVTPPVTQINGTNHSLLPTNQYPARLRNSQRRAGHL